MRTFARRSQAEARQSRSTHRPFPIRNRISLPSAFVALLRRLSGEMKQARLRARVGLHFQRVLVGPAYMYAARYAHDRRRAVRLALFARCRVFIRIPGIANAPPFVVQRDAGEIAFDGRHHAPTPVFGDHRNKITGEVGGRRGLRRFRGLAALPAHRFLTAAERLGRTAMRQPVRTTVSNSARRRITWSHSGSCTQPRRTCRWSKIRWWSHIAYRNPGSHWRL